MCNALCSSNTKLKISQRLGKVSQTNMGTAWRTCLKTLLIKIYKSKLYGFVIAWICFARDYRNECFHPEFYSIKLCSRPFGSTSECHQCQILSYWPDHFTRAFCSICRAVSHQSWSFSFSKSSHQTSPWRNALSWASDRQMTSCPSLRHTWILFDAANFWPRLASPQASVIG